MGRGFVVTSRWVFGGEEGKLWADIAVLDLLDLKDADVCLSITQPHGSPNKGGGRHVEFGYALAMGKRCVLVGEREVVFHHLPGVECYPTFEEALAAI